VAAEHHWDRETFLRQLCVKAGIAEDSWETPDARLYCFTAQVFSEEAIAGDEPVTS
jgi:AMMECR1 domain-containing protein